MVLHACLSYLYATKPLTPELMRLWEMLGHRIEALTYSSQENRDCLLDW